tara:strand:+ start:14004 stop:14384 length:381 start_codon:yes stop_codon:yes gene_type:complete
MAENRDEIYSKSLRAGRRTYFFDVRSTRADDYYLTITESKRDFNEDGTPYYKKHKIYLYKEDFNNFKEHLEEMTEYIIKERGEDVISLEKENNPPVEDDDSKEITEEKSSTSFTEVNFDDLGKEEN